MATTAPTTTSIPGNPVAPATEPLPTVAYEVALKHTLGEMLLEAYSRDTKVLLHPEHAGYDHGFLSAVFAAYAGHYPLTLSPDMIWLLIAQGFAIHLRENAEALRGKFVAHEGKLTLVVERTELLRGFVGNDWEGIVTEFSEQIREQIGEQAHSTLVPQFSTTGIVEKAAFEMTLMDAMQEYFDYEAQIICGIPEFILEGTSADWQLLRDCAGRLGQYGLEWWLKRLLPVLDEFVAASEGRPTPRFWQSFFRRQHVPLEACGSPFYIDGHVTVLFPYLMHLRPEQKDAHFALLEEHREAVTRELSQYEDPDEYLLHYERCMTEIWALEEVRLPKRSYRKSPLVFGNRRRGLRSDDLPSGLSVAPFTLNNQGQRSPMEFLAGFMGAAQDPETLAVRPEIGWAVRER